MIPDNDRFPVQIEPGEGRVLCEGRKTERRLQGGVYVECLGSPQPLKHLAVKAVLADSSIVMTRRGSVFRVGRRRPGAPRASRAFRLMPIHRAARQDAWASRKLFLRSE